MPSKQDHKTKADGNAGFALSLSLDNQAGIDWALIALFYAAMHYVEAYLAKMSVHLRSHTTRDNYVGREANLRPIYSEYQDLKFYGYNARYEMTRFTAKDVTDTATKNFEKIKAQITPLL